LHYGAFDLIASAVGIDGEPATTLAAAAVSNAVFDATGVRLRRAPFTPERVKSALTSRQT